LTLRPQMGLIVPTPDDRSIWSVGGIINVGGKPKCLKRTSPFSVTLSTTNTTCTTLE
jgi:hypothetical protein